MYFSDELYLVSEIRKKDELKQFDMSKTEKHVWCDLFSISANEISDAGQNGHKAEARALVHIEDYSGEKVVRCIEGNILIPAGYYEVYRTYLSGDCIELYLKETEGIR